MRGRKPVGPEVVERLAGSAAAKRRLRVVLETLAGTRRVQDACRELGIGEVRFNQLRQEVLAGALAALEPRPKGRPPRSASPAEAAAEGERLAEQVETLQLRLRTAQAREEIALAGVPVVSPLPAEASAEKKTRRRTARRRRR